MKKLLALAVLILCAGCQITGPYTGTKYSIGIDDNDGFFIKAKPFDFDGVKKILE